MSNTQNRLANGRFASKKEAQRLDCREMITRYRASAKTALQHGQAAAARALVSQIAQLRAAFFADFGEEA